MFAEMCHISPQKIMKNMKIIGVEKNNFKLIDNFLKNSFFLAVIDLPNHGQNQNVRKCLKNKNHPKITQTCVHNSEPALEMSGCRHAHLSPTCTTSLHGVNALSAREAEL